MNYEINGIPKMDVAYEVDAYIQGNHTLVATAMRLINGFKRECGDGARMHPVQLAAEALGMGLGEFVQKLVEDIAAAQGKPLPAYIEQLLDGVDDSRSWPFTK